LTILKPVSSAIAIGSGGPFGAEGPIIATGGALGSLLGQWLPCTSHERKALLAAGAAAGMAATFGTPLAAVLLALELLVFEYRARTLVPVAVASVTAAVLRSAVVGTAPVFILAPPHVAAMTVMWAVIIGAVCGVLAVVVTWLVYAVEDSFEHLPIPWMWWPALGGLVVGGTGFIAPRTLGVGYDNIDDTLSGALAGGALLSVCGLKFISWLFALSSGTSGGTLAPLLTFGGGIGAAIAQLAGRPFDAPILALVGMASLFAGASRAVLASIVFGFEATQQPAALLPLLAGGVVAYFVSSVLMPTTIMTEKIVRRGVTVPVGHGPLR
jgi:H+/Cl- antiporter ClcA